MQLQDAIQRLFIHQKYGSAPVRRPLSDEEAAVCAAWLEEHQPELGSLLREMSFLCQRLGRFPQVSLALLGNPQTRRAIQWETLLRFAAAAEWDVWADANAEDMLKLVLVSALCDALDHRALKGMRKGFPWPEGLSRWWAEQKGGPQ